MDPMGMGSRVTSILQAHAMWRRSGFTRSWIITTAWQSKHQQHNLMFTFLKEHLTFANQYWNLLARNHPPVALELLFPLIVSRGYPVSKRHGPVQLCFEGLREFQPMAVCVQCTGPDCDDRNGASLFLSFFFGGGGWACYVVCLFVCLGKGWKGLGFGRLRPKQNHEYYTTTVE